MVRFSTLRAETALSALLFALLGPVVPLFLLLNLNSVIFCLLGLSILGWLLPARLSIDEVSNLLYLRDGPATILRVHEELLLDVFRQRIHKTHYLQLWAMCTA